MYRMNYFNLKSESIKKAKINDQQANLEIDDVALPAKPDTSKLQGPLMNPELSVFKRTWNTTCNNFDPHLLGVYKLPAQLNKTDGIKIGQNLRTPSTPPKPSPDDVQQFIQNLVNNPPSDPEMWMKFMENVRSSYLALLPQPIKADRDTQTDEETIGEPSISRGPMNPQIISTKDSEGDILHAFSPLNFPTMDVGPLFYVDDRLQVQRHQQEEANQHWENYLLKRRMLPIQEQHQYQDPYMGNLYCPSQYHIPILESISEESETEYEAEQSFYEESSSTSISSEDEVVYEVFAYDEEDAADVSSEDGLESEKGESEEVAPKEPGNEESNSMLAINDEEDAADVSSEDVSSEDGFTEEGEFEEEAPKEPGNEESNSMLAINDEEDAADVSSEDGISEEGESEEETPKEPGNEESNSMLAIKRFKEVTELSAGSFCCVVKSSLTSPKFKFDLDNYCFPDLLAFSSVAKLDLVSSSPWDMIRFHPNASETFLSKSESREVCEFPEAAEANAAHIFAAEVDLNNSEFDPAILILNRHKDIIQEMRKKKLRVLRETVNVLKGVISYIIISNHINRANLNY